MEKSVRRTLALVWSLAGFSCAADPADDQSAATEFIEREPGSPTPAAQVSAATQYFEITSWDATGSGCPSGSFNYTVLTDTVTKEPYVQLEFEEYKIVANHNVTTQSKECEIYLSIKPKTKGAKYAVARVEFYGYRILQPGTNGEFFARYGWDQGVILPKRETSKKFTGPEGVLTDDREFIHRDTLPTLDWSRCDETRQFRMYTRLSLTNPRKTDGEIMLNAVKGNFSARIYGRVEPCTN